MARFSVGNPAANDGDLNEPYSMLWNPASNIALHIVSIDIVNSGLETGGANIRVARTTTTGTSGDPTQTPDADNSLTRRAAPGSGALLTRGTFTVTPTEQTPALFGVIVGEASGSMVGLWFPEDRPLEVPPGTGVALIPAVTVTAWSATWTWDEG